MAQHWAGPLNLWDSNGVGCLLYTRIAALMGQQTVPALDLRGQHVVLARPTPSTAASAATFGIMPHSPRLRVRLAPLGRALASLLLLAREALWGNRSAPDTINNRETQQLTTDTHSSSPLILCSVCNASPQD